MALQVPVAPIAQLLGTCRGSASGRVAGISRRTGIADSLDSLLAMMEERYDVHLIVGNFVHEHIGVATQNEFARAVFYRPAKFWRGLKKERAIAKILRHAFGGSRTVVGDVGRNIAEVLNGALVPYDALHFMLSMSRSIAKGSAARNPEARRWRISSRCCAVSTEPDADALMASVNSRTMSATSSLCSGGSASKALMARSIFPMREM